MAKANFRSDTRLRLAIIACPDIPINKNIKLSEATPPDGFDKLVFSLAGSSLQKEQHLSFLKCYSDSEAKIDQNANRAKKRLILLLEKTQDKKTEFRRYILQMIRDEKRTQP